MTLDELNALADEPLRFALFDCCGSQRWAKFIAAARPFESVDALVTAAARAADALTPEDWNEAFAQHPAIGSRATTGSAQHAAWSQGEQRAVAIAETDLLERLADANARYRERFGRVFLVRAEGRSAEEMLDILEERLENDDATEFAASCVQQRAITALRLRKLVGEA